MVKKEKKNRIVVYFEQRDIVRPIALAVVVVGVVTVWLPLSWVAYMLATILIPSGLVTYIVAASKTVSHDEVPDLIGGALRDYNTDFIESKTYRTEVLKHPAPHETETHVFGEGSRYYKKLKTGAVISDVYSKSHILFTQTCLIIVSRRISVTELDGLTGAGMTDLSRSIPFEDIGSAELCEKEYEVTLSDTKEAQKVKQFDFVVKLSDGEELCIPSRDDTAMIKICEEIKRRLGK